MDQRTYALLVTGDELAETARVCLVDEYGIEASQIEHAPRPVIPKGFSAGAAGGIAPLIVRGSKALSSTQLCAPVVNAALALVVSCYPDAELCESTDPATSAAAAANALRNAPAWASAVRLWREHSFTSGESSSSNAISFRVATLRGGKHACTSKQLDGALGEAVLERQPDWTVDLSAPSVLVLCVVVQSYLLVGLLMPPYAPRSSLVMPPEPRPWLTAGYLAGEGHRPHMRPSRAAALVRLLFSPRPAPCAPLAAHGSVLLDPCGGIGILALEAARFAPLVAITLDVDPIATAAAAQNATSAAEAAARAPDVLRGKVLAVAGDAASINGSSSGLRAGSIDAAVADLPFGMLYARMDVGRLVTELARLIRIGGRALLVGSAGPSGTARACVKSAKRYTPGCWRVEAEVASAAGGVALTAVLLERVHERAQPEGMGSHARSSSSSERPAADQHGEAPANLNTTSCGGDEDATTSEGTAVVEPACLS